MLELDQDVYREVIQPFVEKETLEDETVVASKVVPNSPPMKKTRSPLIVSKLKSMFFFVLFSCLQMPLMWFIFSMMFSFCKGLHWKW